jgi:serine/threonine protein phosphatase PrpC
VAEVYQVGYISDKGRKAKYNEDMLLIVQGLCVTLPLPPHPFCLCAVADGLQGQPGKSNGGHEASRLALETVADILIPLLSTHPHATALTRPTTSNGDKPASNTIPKLLIKDAVLEQWVRDAIQQANRVIYHCNADYDITMASTLTVSLLYKRRLYLASIGDSRAYRYNAQAGLQCLTRDHTLAADLVEAELLQPGELYSSPKRHQHYRYLGQNYRVSIDLYQCDLEVGDIILLCTDGLWHMVRDEQIREIIEQEKDAQKLAIALMETANNAGGEGNISAIAINVQ